MVCVCFDGFSRNWTEPIEKKKIALLIFMLFTYQKYHLPFIRNRIQFLGSFCNFISFFYKYIQTSAMNVCIHKLNGVWVWVSVISCVEFHILWCLCENEFYFMPLPSEFHDNGSQRLCVGVYVRAAAVVTPRHRHHHQPHQQKESSKLTSANHWHNADDPDQ